MASVQICMPSPIIGICKLYPLCSFMQEIYEDEEESTVLILVSEIVPQSAAYAAGLKKVSSYTDPLSYYTEVFL